MEQSNPVVWLFRSRKVLLAFLAVVSTLVLHYLNVDPEVWGAIDALLVTVIASVAYEDAAEKGAPQMVQAESIGTMSGDVDTGGSGGM